MDIQTVIDGLLFPLGRLIFFISIGLFLGNLIEAMNWTQAIGKVATPIVKTARLRDISGASFSMAFFSGITANTMLSEAHEKGEMTDRELLLSNLFNSLPTYFMHLPTVFFIAAPFLGQTAVTYFCLTTGAAFLRTASIVLVGRFTLPKRENVCIECVPGFLKDNISTGHRKNTAAFSQTLT
ncbi:MAG: hypothetical protein ACNI27_00995 [Desulfovibrio sp.]